MRCYIKSNTQLLKVEKNVYLGMQYLLNGNMSSGLI